MDNLANFLQPFVDLFKPCVEFIIWACPLKIYRLHNGQRGVIITFGKVHEWRKPEKGPGTWLCFMFEEMTVIQALGGYIDLVEQALTIEDGSIILINSAVEYDVFSVQNSILETENIELLISGVVMDGIREYARKRKNLSELLDNEKMTQELLVAMNRKLKKNGVKIQRVMITDLRPHEVIYACNKIDELGMKIINKIAEILSTNYENKNLQSKN